MEKEAPQLSGSRSEKFKHLKPGIKPIMACVGAPEDFKDDLAGPTKVFDTPVDNFFNTDNELGDTHNVDYFENPERLTKKGFRNRGESSYVISPVDNKDKYSLKFMNCTGLIVAGVDRVTGENISFLSHEDPHYFLTGEGMKNKFVDDLSKCLQEIRERCAEGTIDAVIVGGNYVYGPDSDYSKDYLASIKLLAEETRRVVGFDPVVITGPKLMPGEDNVFYDNNARRLYIVRPRVGDSTTESFMPKDIGAQEDKWPKGDDGDTGL